MQPDIGNLSPQSVHLSGTIYFIHFNTRHPVILVVSTPMSNISQARFAIRLLTDSYKSMMDLWVEDTVHRMYNTRKLKSFVNWQ
jgi:hypothetical protein